MPAAARARAAGARRAVHGRRARRARPQAREVLRRRRRRSSSSARSTWSLKNLPLGRRVARARRLRGPPRPRPLEHPRDDRRRRHADRDRALLVRAAADRRAAAREQRARPVRVLVHGRRAARLLRRARRRTGSRWAGSSQHGWDYQAAKAHMGNWYRVPVGMGAGRDGARLLVLRRQRLPDRLPGAARARAQAATATSGSSSPPAPAALTVGTVQGVIQVQPANADWLYRAGHAGEWIDPISHAHINLVTGPDDARRRRRCSTSLPRLGGTPPVAARGRTPASTRSSAARSRSTASALYLGFHEGGLVVAGGLTPEQAEEATPLHPFLIMGAGIAMLAAFWFLLVARRALVSGGAAPLRAVRPRRLRRARGRHAAGTGAGVPGGERAARPGRRRGRRDRQPARAAQHARRPDGRSWSGSALALLAHALGRVAARAARVVPLRRSPPGWPSTTPPGSPSPPSRRTRRRRRELRRRGRGARAVVGARARPGRASPCSSASRRTRAAAWRMTAR